MEVFSAEETGGFFGRMKAWISGGKSNLTDTEELPTAAITKVSDPASWKRYDYTQECGFSVQFPELPEHSGQVIEVPQSDLSIRYDTYVAETFSDNTVYVVSVWEYPEKVDISKPELNLQEGFAGMLYALPESQVLYLKATSMQAFAHISSGQANGTVMMEGLATALGTTIVGLFVAIPSLVGFNYLRAHASQVSLEIEQIAFLLLNSIEVKYRQTGL